MPAGRPSKMSEEVLEKLKQAYLIGCTHEEACLLADIHLATLYRYFEKNPDFKEKVQLYRENPCLIARITVMNGINENPELAFKYLERKKREEFGPKQEHDHNINGNLTLEVNFVEPDEDQN